MVASFNNLGTFTPDGIIAGSGDLQSRSVVLITGQNLRRGAVLGRITASSKYTLSLSASSDGSQVPAAILAEDTDATSADKTTVAHFGGTFDENALIFGTGHTAASTREALRDYGIKLQNSTKR